MCSCIQATTFEEDVEGADLIFEGVVLKKMRYPESWIDHADDDFLRPIAFAESEYVFFLATHVWKGSRLRDLVVLTPLQSSMCGYDFDEGQRYVVYAHIRESQPMTSICTRTKPAEEAELDRRYLERHFVE